MAIDICCLEAMYLTACKKENLQPNAFILAGFHKAKVLKSQNKVCCFEVFLDQMKESDISSLINMFSVIELSEIEAVDFLHTSPCALFNQKFILPLIRLVGQKVRVVDLEDVSCGKEFVRDLFHGGLPCQVLNLCSWHTRKLNITGKFIQLCALNLDFNVALRCFPKDCFTCMPNLSRLSLCETRISNLWTTCAALSKLPSLQELRFQNCLCCSDTGQCPASPSRRAICFAAGACDPVNFQTHSHVQPLSNGRKDWITYSTESPTREDMIYDAFSDDDTYVSGLTDSTSEESSDESESNFTAHSEGTGNWEVTLANAFSKLTGLCTANGPNANTVPVSFSDRLSFLFVADREDFPWNGAMPNAHEIHMFDGVRVESLSGYNCLTEALPSKFSSGRGSSLVVDTQRLEKRPNLENSMPMPELALKKYKSHHPSPICFEKYYREYIVSSLPCLKVLDNLLITDAEREKAKLVFSQHFEYLPYNRKCKENVLNILQRREREVGVGGNRIFKSNQPYPISNSSISFRRSISAAKFGSAIWPLSRPMSKFTNNEYEDTKRFRPRQFEYHPSVPSLMVFGTLDGELVIVNLENRKVVGYASSTGALNSVLGLCWLKRYPSKLIAGSDNGVLQLYDVRRMDSSFSDRVHRTDTASFTFEEFAQLTSVHVNSTDYYFLASGYTKHVALYDIGSGKRLQIYEDLHGEHINVVKFAHHSPFVFATSSFDREIKMWDLRQKPLLPCYTTASTRGNVMVCFSPDDRYLLSSAVDNEVRQHLAVDGRLHMKLDIAPSGSTHNYTRSYYMNDGDYIVSGSCEESIVHICCAQTGRRLLDVSLEGGGSRKSCFVQSLRGDPFRAFHMSILAAYVRPSTSAEIIQMNLLSSDMAGEGKDYNQFHWCSRGLGG